MLSTYQSGVELGIGDTVSRMVGIKIAMLRTDGLEMKQHYKREEICGSRINNKCEWKGPGEVVVAHRYVLQCDGDEGLG